MQRAWWQALKFTSFLMFMKIAELKRGLEYAGTLLGAKYLSKIGQ